MKDRIARAKKFVAKHQAVIIGITSFAAGAATAHRYTQNAILRKRWGVGITKEQMEGMLDDPTASLHYDMTNIGIGEFDVHMLDLSQLK